MKYKLKVSKDDKNLQSLHSHYPDFQLLAYVSYIDRKWKFYGHISLFLCPVPGNCYLSLERKSVSGITFSFNHLSISDSSEYFFLIY